MACCSTGASPGAGADASLRKAVGRGRSTLSTWDRNRRRVSSLALMAASRSASISAESRMAGAFWMPSNAAPSSLSSSSEITTLNWFLGAGSDIRLLLTCCLVAVNRTRSGTVNPAAFESLMCSPSRYGVRDGVAPAAPIPPRIGVAPTPAATARAGVKRAFGVCTTTGAGVAPVKSD